MAREYLETKRNIMIPDLTELFYESYMQTFKDLYAIRVGTIISFNTETQTAKVKIAFKQILNDEGTKMVDYPALIECPCITLSGGTSYLSMPITVGDSCLIFFNDRDIDNWFISGEDQGLNTYRMHDISDGFVLVGVRNLTNKIVSYLTNAVKLQYNDTNFIKLENGKITETSPIIIKNGDITINGNLIVNGNIFATGTLGCTGVLTAGNGVTGTFSTSVTVLNGIVTGGT